MVSERCSKPDQVCVYRGGAHGLWLHEHNVLLLQEEGRDAATGIAAALVVAVEAVADLSVGLRMSLPGVWRARYL
jgi:hypothetical protein